MTPENSTSKVAIAFIFVGIVLFGASLNDPFHFDDTLILRDGNVTNPAQWFHFLNPLHLRQLTFFSFYLSYMAGGENPLGFHIVNVVVHLANAILLYYLLSQFLKHWVAVTAGAIFLVHPIQTEAVLYVYQRSVLLACLFSLLSLIAFHKKKYWLAAICFVCAFESKESAIAVPIALALLFRHKSRWPLFAGSVAAGVGALALLLYSKNPTVGIAAARDTGAFAYLIAQCRVIYTYLRLLVWPYPQSLEYTFPPSPGVWVLLAEIAGIAAIAAAGLWMWRQDRWKVFGLSIISFFVLLAPTSSIVPSADAAFEHRLYLPMLAFSVFAASALALLPRRTVLAVPVLAVLAVFTIQRANVWGSDVALWEDTVKKAPAKARAWFNLGGAHLKTNPERAAVAFNRALELEPFFPAAYYNLGIIEQGKGNAGRAIVYFQKAIEQDDTFWPAWNNMGNTFFTSGQRERALTSFENTLRLNPHYWPAQYNSAIVLFQSGRFEQAIPKLRIVLAWRPDFKEARYVLATCLSKTGQQTEAEQEWKQVREMSGQGYVPEPGMIAAPQ